MTFREKYEPEKLDTLPGQTVTLIVHPDTKRILDVYAHLKLLRTSNLIKEILFEYLDKDPMWLKLVAAEGLPFEERVEAFTNIVEEIVNK
jgi:hypothetical protein